MTGTPLLSVRDISISFGGIKAVQNVNFDIYPGEILGLIGPNGSGKSTCVNLITGVYPLDGGTIVFDGAHLTEKQSIADRAQLGMGRTFQTPRPFANLTVYENVHTIALQNNSFARAAEKADQILAQTGLAPLRNTLSAKLPIEKRKWLDLARILAIDAKLVMMDEVMAGLNPSEMEESLELVKNLNQSGVTVLFIEHVMRAVVSLCHRVIVLNEGKLLAEGEPSEVLEREEVITAYIGGGKKDGDA